MMKPQFTEFVIVRPKIPTSRALLYRADQDEVYHLEDYIFVAILNSTSSQNVRPVEEDKDLTNYVFYGTRFGRDEYCHKDDFNTYVEIIVKETVNQLTKKLNLL